ncbi:MAG: hypothetical protein ACOYIS_03435 [Candidatus Cloacimonadaceae bacterium]|jgi:hypothetical protein
MYDIVLTSPNAAEQSASTPVWCRAELMQASAALHDYEPKLINVYKGEELLAQMPVYEQSYLGFTRLMPSKGSFYQGVHFYHNAGIVLARKGLDELRICSELAIFLKKHYKKFNITLAPSNYDMRGFIWNKLKVQPLYTYVHDYTLYDYTLDAQPMGKERRKLRLADRQGYTFQEFLDASAFMELRNVMFKRKSMQWSKDGDRLKTYIEDLAKVGLIKQHNVCRDDKIVSINIILQGDDQVAYSLFRSSVKEEMDKGVSLWHTDMLIKTMESSCKVLDFCGANVPEVARFKASMGHQLQLFFRVTN